ncbi:MAG: hypothetical protein K6T85_16505 [Gorillibacterium sp.]|nr:hypothetical protein [Gorillibacterium sp.]
MRKAWTLSIMLGAVLLVATGCGQKPGLSQAAPTEKTNQGVGENDIAPASPVVSSSPVASSPESTPTKVTKKKIPTNRKF